MVQWTLFITPYELMALLTSKSLEITIVMDSTVCARPLLQSRSLSMMKFLVSIIASAAIMTAVTATATAIDTQKAVKEAPEVIKVNTKSGTSESETIYRSCPPFC